MTIIIAKRHYLDCLPTKSDTTKPRSRGMNCPSLHLEREMNQGQTQPHQKPALQVLALALLNHTVFADFPTTANFNLFYKKPPLPDFMREFTIIWYLLNHENLR